MESFCIFCSIVSNILDQDQAGQFVKPDMESKLFAEVISWWQKMPLVGLALVNVTGNPLYTSNP